MKYKKVFLVNIARDTNQIQLPVAFAVLVNTLRRHDIPVELLDLIPIEKDGRTEAFRELVTSEPAIFGFSIVAGNRHIGITENYAKIVKQINPEHMIVFGGPLPTAVPDLMLNHFSCDYVVAGEGETTFPNMIRALQAGETDCPDIDGVFCKTAEGIVGSRPKWIRKLDGLSQPDYSLFDMDFYIDYLRETDQSFEIMASRGCRGHCSFCYKFCGAGLSIREPDAVLDEMEEIANKYGIHKYYFVDENFLEVKKWFLAFIDAKRKRGLDYQFICQARLDAIDDEICRLGSSNGLLWISSGVESVSQETLNRVNKKLSVGAIEEKFRLMEAYGIKFSVSFIMGFPWDKEQDYIAILEFIERNRLQKRFKIHYLTPLPKTRLYDYAKEHGYIKDDLEYIQNLGDLYWERMVNMTKFSDEQFDRYYQHLYQLGQKDVVYPKYEKYLSQIRRIH